MSVYYRIIDDSILVLGRTFPHKEKIKSIGGRFNGTAKTWSVPKSESAIRALDVFCEELAPDNGSDHGPLSAAQPKLVRSGGTATPSSGSSLATPPLVKQPGDISIQELVDRSASAISAAFPERVWVVGELHNVSERTSGLFFELSMPKGEVSVNTGPGSLAVKAVCWQSKLDEIRKSRFGKNKDSVDDLPFKEGLLVRVLVQVNLYRDRGQLSLIVHDIDPSYTLGALALARAALLRELRAKGLDTANAQLPLPLLPLKIGLITARNSMAYSDFVDQLREYGYPGQVFFVAATMQGERTSLEVAAAMQKLIEAGCELVVITRGGGSQADLRWFDDRELAFAIAQANCPIVAAIGHHEDRSVAEEVAHRREKTPTAAADFVIGRVQLAKDRAADLESKLLKNVGSYVESIESKLHFLTERVLRSSSLFSERVNEKLAEWNMSLQRSWRRAFLQRENFLELTLHKLSSAAGSSVAGGTALTREIAVKLDRTIKLSLESFSRIVANFDSAIVARDPKPWMAKGWTQLFLPNTTKPVQSVAEVDIGDSLVARLQDGKVSLDVKSCSETEREGNS